MKQELERDSRNKHMLIASRAIDALLASSGPIDLCRRLVHSEFVPESSRGCELLFLDNKSTLHTVAGYGRLHNRPEQLSAWDVSPLSEAIREKRGANGVVEDDEGMLLALAVPFVSSGVPVGLLAMYLDDLTYQPTFTPEVDEFYSKLGALYLNALDFRNVSNDAGAIGFSAEDLTNRQLTILGHIENGLVNLEIAKLLMLSESTIRQETVRIYRALGVGNRQEAVKKARALGLLSKTPPRDKQT